MCVMNIYSSNMTNMPQNTLLKYVLFEFYQICPIWPHISLLSQMGSSNAMSDLQLMQYSYNQILLVIFYLLFLIQAILTRNQP